jgi:hypothetical protein
MSSGWRSPKLMSAFFRTHARDGKRLSLGSAGSDSRSNRKKCVLSMYSLAKTVCILAGEYERGGTAGSQPLLAFRPDCA